MLRGDELYVKWKLLKTGRVFEDLVDLKAMLPSDIRYHEIHFTIKEEQLLVYLITPDRKPADMPVNGPKKYHHLKVLTLSSNYGREVINP